MSAARAPTTLGVPSAHASPLPRSPHRLRAGTVLPDAASVSHARTHACRTRCAASLNNVGERDSGGTAQAKVQALLAAAEQDAASKAVVAAQAAASGAQRALNLAAKAQAFWSTAAAADVAASQALDTHRAAVLSVAPPGAYTRSVTALSSGEFESVLLDPSVDTFRLHARGEVQKIAEESAAAAQEHLLATERAAAANRAARQRLHDALRAVAQEDVTRVLGSANALRWTHPMDEVASQAVARAAAHAIASFNATGTAAGEQLSTVGAVLHPSALAGEFLADAAARSASTDALVAAFASKTRNPGVAARSDAAQQ